MSLPLQLVSGIAKPFSLIKTMPRVSPVLLVIVHQQEYPLARLLPLFRQRGLLVRQVFAPSSNFDRLQTTAFDGVVVLGGDLGAHDGHTHSFLRHETELLRAAHASRVPVLGICLGGQLITRALGGVVRPLVGREIGWHTVRVLEGTSLLGPAGEYSKFLWHKDAFELPPGAEPLAFTQSCLQAYRLERTYALQFHPEMTRSQVAMLLKSHSAELLGIDEVEAERILERTVREDVAYGRAASILVDAFCNEVADYAASRREAAPKAAR